MGFWRNEDDELTNQPIVEAYVGEYASGKSENAVNAHAFSAINRIYSNDALWPTLLRGHALGVAGKLPPLARALWRHAAGV